MSLFSWDINYCILRYNFKYWKYWFVFEYCDNQFALKNKLCKGFKVCQRRFWLVACST